MAPHNANLTHKRHACYTYTHKQTNNRRTHAEHRQQRAYTRLTHTQHNRQVQTRLAQLRSTKQHAEQHSTLSVYLCECDEPEDLWEPEQNTIGHRPREYAPQGHGVHQPHQPNHARNHVEHVRHLPRVADERGGRPGGVRLCEAPGVHAARAQAHHGQQQQQALGRADNRLKHNPGGGELGEEGGRRGTDGTQRCAMQPLGRAGGCTLPGCPSRTLW